MSQNDLEITTPRYLQARIRGHREKEQGAWDMARWVSYWAVLPHAKKGSVKNVTSLAKFPWDVKGANTSAEEMAAIRERLERIGKQHWGEDYRLKLYGDKTNGTK